MADIATRKRGWFGRRRKRSRGRRIAEAGFLILVALLFGVSAAPQLLAFPYSAEIGLGADDVVRLRRNGEAHPALAYYDGRRCVEDLLRRSGGDVDVLFSGP